MLRQEHAKHLASFHIPPVLIEAAGVRSVTDAEARETLGLNGHQDADLSGILFRYSDPMTGVRVGGRIRLDHPLSDGGKYISEPGCRHLFFPLFPKEWLADTSIHVVFVESEKAALALLALTERAGRKLIPIAIGGCWGWRRRVGKRPLPDGGSEPETGPSPDLDLIEWQGRPAILTFDSNAVSSSDVRRARRALARELAGRGATVLIAEVPAAEGVNGPDDLIAVSGDEASLRVLAEADRGKVAEACRRGRLMAIEVDGATLLDEARAFIRRFVFLSEAQARVAALWTVHTHAFGAAECTPYLAIGSPEKRSGKSRLLEVLDTLVSNSWFTGRVTAAVLYRKIDAESPTLLLDESDAAFKSGEEYGEALRGILNTGHRRGGKTTCCVKLGVGISYQNFSTFSPKAIAGIGKLPATIADRSIPLDLRRKMRSDKIERFRLRDIKPKADRLRERLEAWGCQKVEQLHDACPELPEKLSDRQQDGAEPLLAIADMAGGEWPQAARHALVSLCCGTQAADDSNGTLLLSDIRQSFKTRDTDRLSSAELTNALAELETSPWGEWKNGKPITFIGLASLLKPFGISPHNIRESTAVLKGYEINDFGDAWARYLAREDSPPDTCAPPSPSPANATPLQANSGAGSSGFQSATGGIAVAAQKHEKPNKNVCCSGVAPSERHTAEDHCEISEEL